MNIAVALAIRGAANEDDGPDPAAIAEPETVPAQA